MLVVSSDTGATISTPLLPQEFLLIEGMVFISALTQGLDQVRLRSRPHKTSMMNNTDEKFDKFSQTSFLYLSVKRVYGSSLLLQLL